MLLTELKRTTTRIQEYFANLSTLQDFSQECVIEGTQGRNVDTKVVEESHEAMCLKEFKVLV
jgi:hypothetical protein